MELSTPFVSIRSILSTIGLKDSTAYVVNGLLMLATFFVCRVLMWPYVYYWYSGLVQMTVLQVSINIFVIVQLKQEITLSYTPYEQTVIRALTPRKITEAKIRLTCTDCRSSILSISRSQKIISSMYLGPRFLHHHRRPR